MNTYFHKHFLGQTEDMIGILLRRGKFHWLPNDDWTFENFLSEQWEGNCCAITARTGSNKAVERSFNSFFWNNGCFNEDAGRAVKMRYRTRCCSTQKFMAKNLIKYTYFWAFSNYRNIFSPVFFSHVPWFYKWDIVIKDIWPCWAGEILQTLLSFPAIFIVGLVSSCYTGL